MSARVAREPGLPPACLYVSQDNYGLVRPEATGYRYLYSDSATSCVILALAGKGPGGEALALLAHVSQPRRWQALFRMIDERFAGPVRVWARGANPGAAAASVSNTQELTRWLERHAAAPRGRDAAPWHVARASLRLGEGDPRDHHAYGLDLERRVASERSFRLTPEQRDPTGGVQTLFSMFGASVPGCPPLWNAEEPFPRSVQRALAATARRAGWTALARLRDQDILDVCSSTPAHELPWFAETMRMSARLVEQLAGRESAGRSG